MNYDDPRLVAKAKRESKIRERASREVVLSIMATTAGRRWVYERLTALSAFHTPYAPGDPHATMFNCGMQNAGFMFLAEILGCAPSEYITMLRENDNASGTDDDNDSNDDTGDDNSASN